MSGICGIVSSDAAPVDRSLLEKMTVSMEYRGPDARSVWHGDRAGFGHTLLRTTFESESERQPLCVDGRYWITADARIDGRSELKRKLAGRRGVSDALTDAELILHAYSKWEERCVDHLIGDFVFAIWDGDRKRLFCARDHFGIKPFFYSVRGHCLVFSNTLDCVRLHPGVSNALDDLAIADFLLFGTNQNTWGTAHADVRRLAPAGCLTWSKDGLEIRKYWSLSSGASVSYRKTNDYVEHFRELLAKSVEDRLRTFKAGVEMSGGLDSTSVAAMATKVLAQKGRAFDLRAFTIVYDRLIPHEERRFAGVAAQALGIPIHYCVADDDRLYERFDDRDARFPEPRNEWDAAVAYEELKRQAEHSRVALTGWDGDALLSESPKPYFRKLLREGRLVKLAVGLLGYAAAERRLPRRLFARQGGSPANPAEEPKFPVWINPALEKRLGLRARWLEVTTSVRELHELRPFAHAMFENLSATADFFDGYDPGTTGLPLEVRHPLLDLRVVEYCLSIPPFPWSTRKRLLREAMAGHLPDSVRLRQKTPLVHWPLSKMLHDPRNRWIDGFEAFPGLDTYADRSKIPLVWGAQEAEDAWINLRPLSLNLWMQHNTPTQLIRKSHEQT